MSDDYEIYTSLLWGAKSMIRHSAHLLLESYRAAPEQCVKLRSRAFRSFHDAQTLANRAHRAAYGKECPLLLAQLDEELERQSQ